MSQRSELAQRHGQRTTFRGTFVRFGQKSGWYGPTKTILMTDIVDSHGAPMCDHLWFTITEEFRALDLHPGDVVQFDGRITIYKKGYRGRGGDDLTTDYRLSRPTRTSKVVP